MPKFSPKLTLADTQALIAFIRTLEGLAMTATIVSRKNRFAVENAYDHAGKCQRKFEREARSRIGVIAADGEVAAHVLRREDAAVQPETVPIFARGKTLRENAAEVFGSYAHAIVRHFNLDAVAAVAADRDRDHFFRRAALPAGVLGIVEQIKKYLERLVAVEREKRNVFVITRHVDLVSDERPAAHPQRVFHEVNNGDRLAQAGDFRVILLRGDNFLDVRNAFRERFDFFEKARLFISEVRAKAFKMIWHMAAIGILRNEPSQIYVVLREKSSSTFETAATRDFLTCDAIEVARTFTLLRTLPTLCRTLVATKSAIPAMRDVCQ